MEIKDLPKNEKPREKALIFGFDTLNDIELIALFLCHGVKNNSVIDLAKKLLDVSGGLSNINKLEFSDLIKIKGIGKIKAISILGIFELTKRIYSKQGTIIKIKNPQDVLALLEDKIKNEKSEHLYLLLLDRQCNLINCKLFLKGTSFEIRFNNKEIISYAMKYNAHQFILVHNHPFGESNPSRLDIKSTLELKNIAQTFSIVLADHIIISSQGYSSFKEIFPKDFK
ncbi:MAG: DNA repair protein RadC [Bacillales bacterium]|jgi:DNA repair protein RadC|nr:DNA repair protein RadC [Bacillales bacterium]